jgi:hypothetical protein
MDAACAGLNALLLCLPAAALGLLTVMLSGEAGRGGIVAVAIALVVFPRLFRFNPGDSGGGPCRVRTWHVRWPAASLSFG